MSGERPNTKDFPHGTHVEDLEYRRKPKKDDAEEQSPLARGDEEPGAPEKRD